jgi:hypothetical protein
MAVPRIQDLSAYSMAQIQQSLNQYTQNSNKFGTERASNYRMPGYRDFLINQNARQGYKSGSGYGIEDEYRYMVGEKGFVGEKAGGSAPAAETQAETTTTTKTDPVINNVYGNEIDNRTTPGPTPKDFIDKFGGNKETYAHSGLAAVKAAEKAGYSIADIQQMGIDQGISFGSGARTYFDQQRQKSFDDQLAAIQQQNAANLQQLTIDQNTRLDKMAAEQKAASEKLALGQRTSLLNQARSGQMGALQIGGATQTPRTGGTQGFKRRKLQINPVTANALAGILGGTSAATQTNVLNP